MVERELWLAVIQQAITDALGRVSGGHTTAPWLIQRQAINWFKPKSIYRSQFETVCALAGADPDATRRAAAAALIGHAVKGLFKVPRVLRAVR